MDPCMESEGSTVPKRVGEWSRHRDPGAFPSVTLGQRHVSVVKWSEMNHPYLMLTGYRVILSGYSPN